MKKIQLLAFAIAFFSFFSLLAQSENDPCSAPCLGPTGTTSGATPPADGQSPNTNLPCGGGGTAEDNPTWYTFVAGQTNFTLNINVPACASGSSLQVTLFEGDDCSLVSAVSCINCVTTGTINVETVPGRQYWIQVDGCAEAVCNFSLTYDPNSILKNIPVPTILGATNTCLGSTLKYEAILATGLISSGYKWEIIPASAGKIINQDTTTANIEWASAGTFQLCATPKFNVKCPVTGLKKGCVTVTVNPTSWNPAECKINLCETQLPYNVSLVDCIKTTNPNFNETPNPANFLISQQSSGTATNQVSYTTAQGQCGGTVKLITTISAQLNPINVSTGSYVNIPKVVSLQQIVVQNNPTFKGTITPSTITILEKKTGIYLKKIKYKADSGCEGTISLKVWVIKKGGMLQENPVSSKIANEPENDLDIETSFIASDDMDFAVYPNPSNGTFQLDFAKEKEDFQVRIFDANGRLILEDKNNKTIDLQAFSKGVYWLKISDGDWSEVVRLMKM